jgi:hypothetical protein
MNTRARYRKADDTNCQDSSLIVILKATCSIKDNRATTPGLRTRYLNDDIVQMYKQRKERQDTDVGKI